MVLRVVLAAAVATLALTGTAAAHPQPAGFGFGASDGWLYPADEKVADFRQAAAAAQQNSGAASARCRNGSAAGYACDDIDLMSNLPLAAIGGGEIGNDIWGWDDGRREYAIMGKTNGTAFVDISDPRRPRFLGHLPTQAEGDRRFWRDIKVYKDHAFIVSEHFNHGMQVFDLKRLRHVRTAPVTFTADAVYAGVSNTHNLDINESTGYAYLVGTNTCNAGPHIVDIRKPTRPEFAGCVSQDGYTHDTECEIYRGPDRRYRGREICFSSNEDTVTIVDVTDKSNPVQLSRTGYPTARYTHQGWLTRDWKHFVFNDELDELGASAPEGRQTTYVLNVENLTSPGTVMASPNNTTSTDHNLYIRDGIVHESNYSSGLRLFSERSVPSGDLEEIAYFDVYPEDDAPGFHGGTWSNYSWFDDGIVAVSSIDRGLFVLDISDAEEDD
jgi:choice-of-anchor B domain-containing protein